MMKSEEAVPCLTQNEVNVNKNKIQAVILYKKVLVLA